MPKKIKKSDIFLKKIVFIAFILLIVIKVLLITVAYSYVLQKMGVLHMLYYFFTLMQSDFLILGIALALIRAVDKQKYLILKILFLLGVIWIYALYRGDLLVILSFQQRLSFTTGLNFLSAGPNVVFLYSMIFLMSFLLVVFLAFLLAKSIKIKINENLFLRVMIASFLRYGIPFPQISFLGVELPEKNILDKVARNAYELSLQDQKEKSDLSTKKKLDLPEIKLENLEKRKSFWLEIAKKQPEEIFQTFGYSSLKKAKDQYGDSYVFEVLSAAVAAAPELAFSYIDVYKDRKDEQGDTVVKPLLKIAIQQKPELAFRYLDKYQDIVEWNEKIAKSLLNFAAQQYKDPLTFEELFHEVKGRNNKKNLILVFLESASSVDSQKFWGLNDRMPLTDKVSDDGVSFLQMHANGTSSDMGHIATLLWMEPVVFDYATGTRYQNYTGYVAPLAEFFNRLGYATTFLSTVSLEFLDQRNFLKRAGYQTIIGEEAFEDRKKYTFDAAPDKDLYDKALEIVKEQKSPFFLTLQTISSHTPYNTPYGRTAEAMYRYEDETFSEFYQELKKTDFFKDGILMVVGDHRKMVPLEDEEFAKRGTTAAAKIMAFAIGSWISAHSLDDHLYQQTDLFYSLLSEFWSGEVKVFQKYNDLFTQTIVRNRSVKHRYDQKKSNIANAEGQAGYIDLNRMEIIDGASYFPVDEILNYLRLSIAYQMKAHGIKEWDIYANTADKTYVISHRWVSKKASENSLAAFKLARDAQADGIEFDVSTTKDGKLVIYHGPKIYPHTTCKQETREICQMTREELQKCKLKNGEDILLLEEFLPQVKNRFSFFFLDFKTSTNPQCKQNNQLLLDKAIALVKKYKMDGNTIFSSYDEKLADVLGKRGDVSSALDTFSLTALDQLSGSYFSYFMTPAENFSKKLVENLNHQSAEGVAYVVNSVEYAKKLKEMGVRFLMTDEVAKLKEGLK